MLCLLSPAKKLDFESKDPYEGPEAPEFKSECLDLCDELKALGSKKLGKLMKLSDNLSELNDQRYKNFKKTFTVANSKMALYAFRGDTYVGLDADSLSKSEFQFATKHLRILSGLYGVLKPQTLIQPYRLEMGTKFGIKGSKNLYEFWSDKVTEKINQDLKESKSELIVNCASNEYFKVINKKALDGRVITPVFKEKKGKELKMIGLFAKRARGMMARHIVETKAKNIDDLKKFSYDGYKFQKSLSSELELVFVR